MSTFLLLVIICLVMGVSSYLVGLIPLSFSLSKSKIRSISTFGIGILVGTSLIVIIPEGIETLYSGVLSSSDGSDHETDKDDSHGIMSENARYVGLSLISGFLLMYIIDRLPSFIAGRNANSFIPVSIDMSNLRIPGFGSGPIVSEGGTVDNSANVSERPSGNFARNSIDTGSAKERSESTSVGLTIHAIADGIALGASVSSENSALELIVFVAILIHKAPASFGLSTVLLRDGLTVSAVKKRLATFASAAPLGAVLTWIFIKLLATSSKDNIQWWTGLLLLFSGGTFLYVAMDVMQQLSDDSDPQIDTSSGIDLALSVAGMLVPLVTYLVPDI